MVIEERDLVFPDNTSKKNRQIYRRYYSVAHLRHLSEKRYLADPRRHDHWLALQANFHLFEADGPGKKLGIAPLAGDLFSSDAIGLLAGCVLGNDVLLGCLRSLSLYRHPESGQLIRVNYAGLNVEEFGSVYEGLLEYEPGFSGEGRELGFTFLKGEERAATGSHYTPDNLAQPLLKHSLDHLIEERLKEDNPETALLGLRVADIACGSGHILLAAARRIATELAVVRTGEEQPSPTAYRVALRDVIRNCIYGVDLNPLAVELCKVAMWLEAHNPGQPLNFLDHHIKCGNAIVGFARREELSNGIPNEAFKTLAGDDKAVAAAFRKKNKEDRKHQHQADLDFTPELRDHLDSVLKEWRTLSALPESTPSQIDKKKQCFPEFASGEHSGLLRCLADIPIAQFYIPKVQENESKILTDGEFRNFWRGLRSLQGQGTEAARFLGKQKRLFHWFLEFPGIMDRGGFDCILGNPPFLGGGSLSSVYGCRPLHQMKTVYIDAQGIKTVRGQIDLVAYFFRRSFQLLRSSGILGLIGTNSVGQGDTRAGGLTSIKQQGGKIVFAGRSMRWPGRANVIVSLICIANNRGDITPVLDGRKVVTISDALRDEEVLGDPSPLTENSLLSFEGSKVYGKGFALNSEVAAKIRDQDPGSENIVLPYLSGTDVTQHFQQAPSRWTINFWERNEKEASKFKHCYEFVKENVKPERDALKPSNSWNKSVKKNWWLYGARRPKLYYAIAKLRRVLVHTRVTKTHAFVFVDNGMVYADSLNVFAFESASAFAVLQSTLHDIWAWRYGSTLKNDRRYTPARCFQTFPFPLRFNIDTELGYIGEKYHQNRCELMQLTKLGLSKTFSLFHTCNLSPDTIAKISKKDVETAEIGYQVLLELRRLHTLLDLAVRDAYGWQDLDLDHDFYEVETLPENDRTRYTISPTARREVLERLLAENHARAATESENPEPKPKRARKKQAKGPSLFGET